MGAWGTGSFDNDTAGDWALGLKEARDLQYVQETLQRAREIGADTEVDASLAAEAIAAAEVVARLLGHWGERTAYSAPVDEWVQSHPVQPPDTLVEMAAEALHRVRTAPSELRELWEDSDFEEWDAAVQDLVDRLTL